MWSRWVLTGWLAVVLGSFLLGCAARFDAAKPSLAAPQAKRTPTATSAAISEKPAEPPRQLSASLDALDPLDRPAVKGVGPIVIAGVPKAPGYCPRSSGLVSKPGTCSDREKLFERLQHALRSTGVAAEGEVCRSPWNAEVEAARQRIARRNLDVAKRVGLDRALADRSE